MNDSYRFSNLVRSAEYQLSDEGVEFTMRKFLTSTPGFVPFDKIPMRSSLVKWSSKPLIWAGIIFTFLFVVIVISLFTDPAPEPLALLLYGGLAVIFFTAHILTRVTSEVFLFEGEYLPVFQKSSNVQEAKSFIQSMQNQKREFFKARILRRLNEVSNDDVARYLIYLRESDLVDERGYDELRSLVRKVAPSRHDLSGN